MPTITAMQKVWCSNPEAFLKYKNAPEGERFEYITLGPVNANMGSYGWILLGTAEVICTVEPIEDGISAAVAACDVAEKKLRGQLNDKLAEISAIRQNLLSLPAPKEFDNV